ncbi:MAG TPA: AsmA-like C-terminal region-containing protein [Chitinophagaceae bacterium]|nr:AsmA-like C-terminal region-containing protein [Chitinophagaceae bacterium]
MQKSASLFRRILRKTLKIAGIFLLVLVALALAIPFLFKKPITNLVKREINRNLHAKVDFKDVSLSLFRHFPKVSISLDEFYIAGTGEFSNDTLIYANSADASADLISVIKGQDIKVYGIFLESPRIHAIINKEGHPNWNIAKDSETISGTPDTTATAFTMSLKNYSIHNGYIEYRDESSGTYAEIAGLDHSGSGDFTQDIFILNTNTQAAMASFTQGAIPYLINTKTGIDAAIKIDNRSNTYTFTTDDIRLNNLKLSVAGLFQVVNDSTYNMDIQFKSPFNTFKDILSLIPAVYKKDFDKLQAGGDATFNGVVKGVYGPDKMPAYDVNLEIRNGYFQYPDLPKPVKNIQLDLHALNPDGQPDNAVIDISKGHLEMDKEPFDFRFLFKNPETNQFIDAAVKGKFNLAHIPQFVKLEEGTKLAGLLSADAFVRGNMAALENQQGEFAAGGFFDIKELYYSAKAFPQPVKNGRMNIRLTNTGGIADNTQIDITSGHIEIGNDPLDFSLQVNKPVSAMNFEGNAKGRFTLDNLRQFVTFEPGTTLSGLLNASLSFSGNKTFIVKEQYDKIKLSGEAIFKNIKYVSADYPTGVTISTLAGGFTSSGVSISEFAGKYLKSNFSGSGTLINLPGFALNKESLAGELNASVDKMNLNDWIGTDSNSIASSSSKPATSIAPFLVPTNLDLKINARAGKVTYDKVDYTNINGAVLLNNETIKFEDLKAQALKGTMLLNGSYSTRYDKTNPDIGMSYSIRDMDVQQAFLSFNTVQALMPIGKFLSGKLSSELTMKGSLDAAMMPDLNSLSGKGNLLLIEGVLNKFAPLEKLAAALQIDRLKSISVKDIKNYIEFTNGKVLVRPFTIKVQDIEMHIGGMHGFDQSMDYMIDMKVPRKYLGNEGNTLVNGLVAQAAGKGYPVKLGEMVDLNIKMTGSLSSPILKIDLEQIAGDAMNDLKEQAKDFAEQKIDSAKNLIKDTLSTIKKQAKEEIKNKLKEQVLGKDSTKQTLPKDSLKAKAGGVISNKVKNLFTKPKKNASESNKNTP